MNYTILRNNFYLENETRGIQAALNGMPFFYSATKGKLGWVMCKDFAEAAINILLDLITNKILEFSGPLISYEELGNAIQSVSNVGFEIIPLSYEAHRQELLKSGASQGSVNYTIKMQQDIDQGAMEASSHELIVALKRPLTTLEEGLMEIINSL